MNNTQPLPSQNLVDADIDKAVADLKKEQPNLPSTQIMQNIATRVAKSVAKQSIGIGIARTGLSLTSAASPFAAKATAYGLGSAAKALASKGGKKSKKNKTKTINKSKKHKKSRKHKK
jgi:CelD/BcsL family acetyltransferase involved in cellulose biosynthesis